MQTKKIYILFKLYLTMLLLNVIFSIGMFGSIFEFKYKISR